MKLNQPDATLFIPDQRPEAEALPRITHLGVGAHQDDLEFMAFHGIAHCFGRPDRWFGGVTCTSGAGSPRAGDMAEVDNVAMVRVRHAEQEQAATAGRYGAMFQLAYTSQQVRDPSNTSLAEDLVRILQATRPETLYTHNPADKHDTHVAVLLQVVRALRMLPRDQRPRQLLGCEVWRSLDWVCDGEKIAQDVTGCDVLAQAVNRVFQSQIAGGKRYDLATMGRRRANATFLASHVPDQADQVLFAIDLSPLVADDGLDVADYTAGYIRRFEADVRARIRRLSPA